MDQEINNIAKSDQNLDTRSQHVHFVHLSELGITSCCSSYQNKYKKRNGMKKSAAAETGMEVTYADQ